MTMWLNPGSSKYKNPFAEKAKLAKENIDYINPPSAYEQSPIKNKNLLSTNTPPIMPVKSTALEFDVPANEPIKQEPGFIQNLIGGVKDYATNPKKLFSEIGKGLNEGLSKTGAVKQNEDIANILANNPIMSKVGNNQLEAIKRQRDYTNANPAESVPAIIGKEIPMIPLWMAGEGAVSAVGKGITKLAPSLRPLAEKASTKIPSFIKGGARDAGAYGAVVAPVESIREKENFSQFLDREKNVPAIFLGGAALRGVGKAGGVAGKEAKKALSINPYNKGRGIGVPDAPLNPIRSYSAQRRSGLGPLKNNDVVPLRQGSELSSAIRNADIQTNPLDDIQNAYRRPSLQEYRQAKPITRSTQRKAELGPLKLSETRTPEYKAKQAELTNTFKDLPVGSTSTPMARRTLQESIDDSLGINSSKDEYQGLDAFGKPALKINNDTQKAVAEISSRMNKQVDDIETMIKQADEQTPTGTIRKKVKDMGGIRQANDGIFEERRAIPNWIRNDTTGRPLDEVADTLGMNSDELLAAISDSAYKPRNYRAEAQAIANKDPEYLALGNTLEMLKAELPGKRTLNTTPKLKPRELSPKPEPLPIQPRRTTLSGSLPVDTPIANPKPIKKLAPVKKERLTWTNREGIPTNPKPIRPISEQSANLPPKSLKPIEQEPIKQVNTKAETSTISTANTEGISTAATSPATKSNNKTSLITQARPQVKPVGTKRLSFPDTVAKGDITDPKLAEQIGKTELNYENITNKDTLEVAKKFIQEDKDAAMQLVMDDAPATAESNAVAQLLIKEANDMGKFDQAISMVEKTASKAKTQGQAIQALSMWGRLSPEGLLKYAEKTIGKAKTIKQVSKLDNDTKALTNAMKDVNSKAIETIVKEVESGLGPKISNKKPRKIVKTPKLSDDIIKKLDDIEASARARIANRKGNLNSLPVDLLADYAIIGTAKLGKGAVKFSTWSAEMIKEFGEDLKPHLSKIWDQSQKGYDDFVKANGIKTIEEEIVPEQQLFNKIKASLSEGSPKEKDALTTMIETLHKVAKESPLPSKEKIPTDPLTFVSDAIQKRSQYRDVWNKAKSMIEEQYADNPEALALLDDYLGKGINRTFPEGQLNRSVSQGLKDMEVSIRDIVKEHYSVNSKVRTELVEELIEKAGLSGEDAAILSKYVRNRMKDLTKTKKEQILNQMFKPRLAPKQKELSEKIIELSNIGGFQNQNYKALVGEKLGIPTLDEATAKSIHGQSQKIQTMPEGRKKQVAIAQMLDTIAAKVPPTMLQKIGTLQTMAQLLNPKTAIRNIGGNTGFGVMDNISNTLGAGIDKGLSSITGKRTRVLPSLSTQLKAGKEGFGLGLEDALKKINTTSINTQFDLNTTRTFRSGILGKLETAMNVELRATDRAFYKAAYEESLRSQMKAANVTEPTDAMKEIADYDGLYKTFQDNNAISSFFSGFKKLLNDPVHFAGKAKDREARAFGIGDFIIKYPKTPGNLLARGIDYSPAGFVKVVMEAAKPLMGKEFNQRAFVDAFSRAITGSSGLVGVGALLHRTGILSGKRDSDYDVASLKRQVGLGEYKVNASALKRFVLSGFNPSSAELKKGDNLVTYDWFQPQALPIAMGADIDANGASASGVVGTVLNGLATGVNTFAEQPVMQGVSTMFGQRDFSDGMTKILQGVPSSFVPTLLNQVKQLSDNQKRNTYSPNWIGKTTNLAAGRIPVVEKKLQPMYDALGNKVQTYQDGGNNPLNVFLNPAFVSKYSPSKEAELALRAFMETGETRQIPTVVPKYFTVTGQKFELTPKEYATMQKTVGENTKKAFSRISSSTKVDKQIEAMADAIKKARLEGKKEILDSRGVSYIKSGNTLKLRK